MTKSMTAFARIELGRLTWEIRTVNHRYMDASFKIPESYRGLESRLRNTLRGKVNRGKIDCLLRVNSEIEEAQEISIDQSQLANLCDAIEQVSAGLDNPTAINALEVLQWPGILHTKEVDQSALETQIKQAFDQALTSLLDMREREGEELKRIILAKLETLQSIVAAVREEMPIIVERQKQNVLKRLAELQHDADNNRLEQELVYLAQKSDVAEELDRLNTHVEEIQSSLAEKGPVGRRLDFLMQELNREANTLSSKAIAANTSIQAVELKVIVEQMREQVQNIE